MLNEHLKRLRVLNNVTQQQLAEYLNISTQSVSKWENGLSLPSIEFLPQIARFFHCCVGALCWESELTAYEKLAVMDDTEALAEIIGIINAQKINDYNACFESTPEYAEGFELTHYTITSYFLPSLYNYLKARDSFSIKETQANLMIGYSQIIGIVKSLYFIGILEEYNGEYIYHKEKVDLMLPFMNSLSCEPLKFHEHLKKIRTRSNVSQKELAAYLNVTPQSISKWENGASLPSTDLFVQIVNFFDFSIDSYFSQWDLEFYENHPHSGIKHSLMLIPQIAPSDLKVEESPPPAKEKVDFPLESLFLPAVYKHLKENDRTSVSAIQHAIGVGYSDGCKIRESLYSLDIISYIPTGGWKIEKDKIDLLLPFINGYKGE